MEVTLRFSRDYIMFPWQVIVQRCLSGMPWVTEASSLRTVDKKATTQGTQLGLILEENQQDRKIFTSLERGLATHTQIFMQSRDVFLSTPGLETPHPDNQSS